VEVIDPVPLRLEPSELAGSLNPPSLGGELVKLFERAQPLIEPKAVYTTTHVSGFEDDLVHLEDGHVFKGVILADMLDSGQEVIPYVVTIGAKLESEISNEKNILRSYLLDKIGNYALHNALTFLKSLAYERLGSPHGALSEFSPGTGTGELFGIEQQKPMFEVLDPTAIGVHLTPSLMMVPRKSESGVLAVTPEEYVACAYCPRKCESRSTPFVGEYRRIKRTLAFESCGLRADR